MSDNNNLPQKKDNAGLALQKTGSLLSITDKILANRTQKTQEISIAHLPFEPEMVFIKGGRFLMGSPETELGRFGNERQHEVTVRDFEIGKYPVTQAQWQAVMGNNPSFFKGDDLPVENVSWNDVQVYIAKLNAKTGKNYRLPTEAEWEYACRAGTTSPFAFGETISTEQVNYNDNYVYGNGKKGKYREKTTRVSKFSPNMWGLYDMHGNVLEWTASIYTKDYDGSELLFSSHNDSNMSPRVLRGGSWNNDPQLLRSAARFNGAPDFFYNGLGFRLSRM